MCFLGIEIGGSKLQLVTGTADGRILARERLAVDRTRGAAGIREQIRAAVVRLRPRFPWRAAGVGFGGPVEWRTGRIRRSHQLAGWDGFALGDWLGELAGVPVVVDNDTNAAAYAEAVAGAGTGADPVFYTNSGSGVGGGLVVGGRIYHGAAPGEAEFGHLRLDSHGDTVERRCSGWAVDARVREVVARYPDSVLGRLAAPLDRGEAAVLAAALRENCPLARRILDETAADLAFALSHVVHLLHPQVVVLGGGLALVGEPWRAAVAAALPAFVMKAFLPAPEVRLSALREDAVPAGALLLAAAGTPPFTLENQDKEVSMQSSATPSWTAGFIEAHRSVMQSLPVEGLDRLIALFRAAWREDRQIFVFGNGGSAGNASHFSTDLGKGASDKLPRPFRVISLNENTAWMTALGNDYAYEDVFVRQLASYARPGDLAFTMSVSGNSPNLVKAIRWAKDHGLITVALVGKKRGTLAGVAEHVLTVDSGHYGHVEDAHMMICHILAYAFMEHPELVA